MKAVQEKNRFIATLLAFAVIPMSGLATDIYLPSMPYMAKYFGQAENSIQLTLSLYLGSYAIAQFFVGSILDAFGRYKLSTLSLFLFMISFWVTAISTDIYMIYAMRVVQGILSAFAIVAKRAFFVDVYEGEERRQYLSLMTIVWSAGPIVAPFIGGYLQEHFGWQSNFYLLAVYSGVVGVLEFLFSGETIRKKTAFNGRNLLGNFKEMIATPDFFLGLLVVGLSYGMIFLFNLSAPFIIEHQLGYTPVTVGYASLIMGIAWMLGGFLGRALMNKPFLPKIQLASLLQTTLILAMYISSQWLQNLYTLLVFAFFIHLAAGFTFNNYFTYCLSRFPKIAGVSGGFTGGVAFILTSGLSYGVVNMLHPATQPDLALGYFSMGTFVMLLLTTVRIGKLHPSVS